MEKFHIYQPPESNITVLGRLKNRYREDQEHGKRYKRNRFRITTKSLQDELTVTVLESSKSVLAFEPTAYMLQSSSTAKQTFSVLWGNFLDMICLNRLASQQ